MTQAKNVNRTEPDNKSQSVNLSVQFMRKSSRNRATFSFLSTV